MNLLGAFAWLCLTIAAILLGMLLLTFLSQPVPARDVAGLGLAAAALGLIGFASLRRVQPARTESPQLGLRGKRWLAPALLGGLTAGVLTEGYDFLQVHSPVSQAIGGGLLAALVVFAAASWGFSRPQNTLF